jgi:hypothetical protein
MDPERIEAELARIAGLPPLERVEAAEALELELRTSLDQIAPDSKQA